MMVNAGGERQPTRPGKFGENLQLDHEMIFQTNDVTVEMGEKQMM